MLILTHRKMLVEKVLSKHEQDKRDYNRRIMNVEHGIFTTFVYFVIGSEGTETSTFRCHLASKTALKKTREMNTLSISSGANCHF